MGEVADPFRTVRDRHPDLGPQLHGGDAAALAPLARGARGFDPLVGRTAARVVRDELALCVRDTADPVRLAPPVERIEVEAEQVDRTCVVAVHAAVASRPRRRRQLAEEARRERQEVDLAAHRAAVRGDLCGRRAAHVRLVVEMPAEQCGPGALGTGGKDAVDAGIRGRRELGVVARVGAALAEEDVDPERCLLLERAGALEPLHDREEGLPVDDEMTAAQHRGDSRRAGRERERDCCCENSQACCHSESARLPCSHTEVGGTIRTTTEPFPFGRTRSR